MTRFSFIEKRRAVELRNGALCTGTTSMLQVRWFSALCLEVSSLSGRVLGHALEADGRPGLALRVLLCETGHLLPVSGVRGVQPELGFILVPSLLFCCFLGNFSTAEAEQNSIWILWVSERAAFPLAWCLPLVPPWSPVLLKGQWAVECDCSSDRLCSCKHTP